MAPIVAVRFLTLAVPPCALFSTVPIFVRLAEGISVVVRDHMAIVMAMVLKYGVVVSAPLILFILQRVQILASALDFVKIDKREIRPPNLRLAKQVVRVEEVRETMVNVIRAEKCTTRRNVQNRK